tara:strand:- start:1724 stop:1858 length:135 start_codon:yes stop_codon:yes gene_type:complete
MAWVIFVVLSLCVGLLLMLSWYIAKKVFNAFRNAPKALGREIAK